MPLLLVVAAIIAEVAAKSPEPPRPTTFVAASTVAFGRAVAVLSPIEIANGLLILHA